MIEFKNQYITGHYELTQEKNNQNSNLINLSLDINTKLNSISLKHNISYEKLFNKYIDIKHIEPERHLDELCRTVLKVIHPSIPEKLVSATYKDNSLLKRIEKIFSENRINSNFQYSQNNVEKTLSYLCSEKIDFLSNTDLLIARHSIEHSRNIIKDLNSLISCLNKNGILLLELPDCLQLMKQISIPMLWECHREYLTQYSSENLISLAGGELITQYRFSYELEDVLVFIIKKKISNKKSKITKNQDEEKIINKYFEKIEQKIYYQKELLTNISKSNPVILLGGGHTGLNYIYLTGIHKIIDYIVDDNVNLNGKYTPCQKHKIISFNEIKNKFQSVNLISSIKPGKDNIVRKRFEDNNIRINSFINIFS